MNYETRDTLRIASQNKVAEVAAAGEALGFWKAATTTPRCAHFLTVVTPDGSHFDITGGSWAAEGYLVMDIASIRGLAQEAITPRNVTRYQANLPTAKASHARPADVIAKDLHRRVSANPEALEIAQKLLEYRATQDAQWVALRAHVETLKGLGYEFTRLDASDYYRAKGYRSAAPREVEVNAAGGVSFSLDTNVSNLGAILAAIGS